MEPIGPLVAMNFMSAPVTRLSRMGRETEALCWGSELSIGFNAEVEPVQKKKRYSGRVKFCALVIKKETREQETVTHLSVPMLLITGKT